MNIPRGEYTFIAPEIGDAGLVRVADEDIFKGARFVKSAGHIAQRGFREGKHPITGTIENHLDHDANCLLEQINTRLRSLF